MEQNQQNQPAQRVQPAGHWDIPVFTGDGRGPSLSTWLNAVALAHDMNGLTTTQTVRLIKARVDGLATAKVESLDGNVAFESIEALVRHLRTLFQDDSDAFQKLNDLWRNGQKQDELIEIYARRVSKIVRDAMGDGNERMGTQLFVSGLRDKETQLHVNLKEPTTIEGAMKEALKFKSAIKMTYNGDRPNKGAFGQQTATVDEPMEIDQLTFRRDQPQRNQRMDQRVPRASGSQQVTCLYCDNKGHFGNNCPELARHSGLWKKYESALQKLREERRRRNASTNRGRGGFNKSNTQ